MTNNNDNDNNDRIEDIKLDAFHWHEALDRISFIAEMFDSVTCNHPVFVKSSQNPHSQELGLLADKVAVELARLYNKISELDPFNPL